MHEVAARTAMVESTRTPNRALCSVLVPAVYCEEVKVIVPPGERYVQALVLIQVGPSGRKQVRTHLHLKGYV